MLLPYLMKDRETNEEESFCIIELSKLFEIDYRIYEMLLEKENIDVNEFYHIAFALLDYGFFHIFIDFTIHYQDLVYEETNSLVEGLLLSEDSAINQIIEKFKVIKKMNK